MRTHLKLLGVLAIAFGIALATALPALGASDDVPRLTGLHAQARSERSLSTLAIASDLAGDAQRHAEAMAARGEIYHSGRTSNLNGWTALGENVGYASSVDEVFQLFMDSPGHRNNIIDASWDSIGIGVAPGDGAIYASVLFGTRSQRPAQDGAVARKPATKKPPIRSARSAERVKVVPSPTPAPSGRTNPVPAPVVAVPAAPAPQRPSPPPAPVRRDASRSLGVLLAVEREHEPLPEPEEAAAIGGVSSSAARERFDESAAERRRRAEQSESGASARTLGAAARCAWRDC